MSAEGARVRVLGILLFVASAAYYASYARVGLYDDEGYLLEGVMRVLDGQVIYRDFHHTYAPGRFYLFAGLFKLFGEDLLVVRATWVVIRATIVVLAWAVARRLIAGPLAWVPPLALLALPGPWHKSFFHLFLIATLGAGIDLFGRGGRRRSFVAGLVLSLAVLFRQDVGIGACVAFAAFAGLDAVLGRRWGHAAASISIPHIAMGLGIVAVPTLLYFISQGALSPMLDKVLFAGMRDNRTNELPFPTLFPILPPDAPSLHAAITLLFVKALYYLPLATFPVYGAILLVRAVRRRTLPLPGEFLLALLGGFALNQVAARSDVPHLLQAIGLVYFVWAIALAAVCARAPAGLRRAASVVLACAVPLVLTTGCAFLESARSRLDSRRYLERARVSTPYGNSMGARLGHEDTDLRLLDLPRARVLVPSGEAAFLLEVQRFLDEHTRPGDYVLTIPGFQVLYFLFDRRNPTEFPHVRRAFDSPDEEAAYITDIDRHRTRYIFLDDRAFDGRPERRFGVYARTTMDWIVEHYQPVKTIGGVLVLERIDGTT